jgi:hypothetical protein
VLQKYVGKLMSKCSNSSIPRDIQEARVTKDVTVRFNMRAPGGAALKYRERWELFGIVIRYLLQYVSDEIVHLGRDSILIDC